MKDWKKILTICSVFTVIFLFSGCLNREVETGVSLILNTPDSVKVEFNPGLPPDEVYEGNLFDISLKFQNEGSTAIAGGDIKSYLLGVSPTAVGKTGTEFNWIFPTAETLTKAMQIEGQNIPGAQTTWELSSINYSTAISSDQTLTFLAKTCFKYGSDVTSEACFSKNPWSGDSDICVVNGPKDVRNEIGPVKVTGVSQYYAGTASDLQHYTFTVSIENIGPGQLFDNEKFDNDCTQFTQQDFNKVEITTFDIGGLSYLSNCTSKTAYLNNGRGEWICKAQVPQIASQYTEMVKIGLTYGYLLENSKQVVIKNTLNANEL